MIGHGVWWVMMARKKSKKERLASKDIISETVNLEVMIDCQKRVFL